MISLVISLVVLLCGYLVYGKIVEKIFDPDDRETPAVAMNDGVDCVPIKTGKSKKSSLIAALPATFMSAVSMTYILMAEEGLGLSAVVSYPIGIAFALALFAFYLMKLKNR